MQGEGWEEASYYDDEDAVMSEADMGDDSGIFEERTERHDRERFLGTSMTESSHGYPSESHSGSSRADSQAAERWSAAIPRHEGRRPSESPHAMPGESLGTESSNSSSESSQRSSSSSSSESSSTSSSSSDSDYWEELMVQLGFYPSTSVG